MHGQDAPGVDRMYVGCGRVLAMRVWAAMCWRGGGLMRRLVLMLMLGRRVGAPAGVDADVDADSDADAGVDADAWPMLGR